MKHVSFPLDNSSLSRITNQLLSTECQSHYHNAVQWDSEPHSGSASSAYHLHLRHFSNGRMPDGNSSPSQYEGFSHKWYPPFDISVGEMVKARKSPSGLSQADLCLPGCLPELTAPRISVTPNHCLLSDPLLLPGPLAFAQIWLCLDAILLLHPFVKPASEGPTQMSQLRMASPSGRTNCSFLCPQCN